MDLSPGLQLVVKDAFPACRSAGCRQGGGAKHEHFPIRMNADLFMTWAGWGATVLCAAAAAYERFRNQRKDEAKEIVTLLATERDTWKSMTETVQAEMAAYRVQMHARLDEANGQLLKLTEENSRLKGATDVTPILRHQEEQSQINVKVLAALDEVLAHLRAFRSERVRHGKPIRAKARAPAKEKGKPKP